MLNSRWLSPGWPEPYPEILPLTWRTPKSETPILKYDFRGLQIKKKSLFCGQWVKIKFDWSIPESQNQFLGRCTPHSNHGCKGSYTCLRRPIWPFIWTRRLLIVYDASINLRGFDGGQNWITFLNYFFRRQPGTDSSEFPGKRRPSPSWKKPQLLANRTSAIHITNIPYVTASIP